MDTPLQVAHAVRRIHSCARCAQRKVKCDRKRPCGACTRHGLDCVFNPLPPRKPRRQAADTQALAGRLRQYETWFRERGINPGQLAAASGPAPSSSTGDDSPVPIQPSQTTHADLERPTFVNKYIDNQDDLESTDSGSDTEATGTDDTPALAASRPFLLLTRHSPSLSTPGSRPAYPPPATIRKLWRAYCDNVDPLTKLLHAPTVQKTLDRAASDTASFSRPWAALWCSIYAAAVMSLRDDACQEMLGAPRSVLLPRYLAAAETALSHAGVLGTSDMLVLQALLLYLLAIRDLCQPRAVWTLTGIAMRIAEAMGLDRDGAGSLSLSPFDVEMRRRLWWQLRMHDFRTAELCGRPKFQGLDVEAVGGAHADHSPTQWPANVNDADLSPGMTGPPLPPLGAATSATDALFVAVKCELLRFTAARLAALRGKTTAQTPWDLYTMSLGAGPAGDSDDLQALEHRLETRYLRYADPSRPLHLMATLMVRCALNILRFMARHPRCAASHDADERAVVWHLCLAILDQQHLLQSNPHLRPFAWHAPFFQQWHAIIHVLDTLRADPRIEQAAWAWDCIEKTYANNPEMVVGPARGAKPIQTAVGSLCLKAWEQREKVQGDVVVPSFIRQLKASREAALARKEKEKQRQGGGDTTGHVIPEQPVSGTETEADTGALDDLLDMDLGAATVNWDQWDTWLTGEGS